MHKLTVKKDRDTGEWVARVTRDGVLVASYFTNDRGDAERTGQIMLNAAGHHDGDTCSCSRCNPNDKSQ